MTKLYTPNLDKINTNQIECIIDHYRLIISEETRFLCLLSKTCIELNLPLQNAKNLETKSSKAPLEEVS